jgi:cell wall assembly regulator SMI1
LLHVVPQIDAGFRSYVSAIMGEGKLESYEEQHEVNARNSLQKRLEKFAQEELEVTFPSDFIEYLSVLGGGSVSSEEFIGLEPTEYQNLVFITNKLREKSTQTVFPKHLIPLRGDGFGNYDCIDTARSGEKSIVVEWIHDSGDVKNIKVLASCYWDWFNGILNLIDEINS